MDAKKVQKFDKEITNFTGFHLFTPLYENKQIELQLQILGQ